jgi:phage shock protein C
MNDRFLLDKSNARLMGVCSGFANWSGIDPLIVRLGVVATSLFLAPVMILLYLVTGFIAPQR